jgi:hypothetical protein
LGCLGFGAIILAGYTGIMFLAGLIAGPFSLTPVVGILVCASLVGFLLHRHRSALRAYKGHIVWWRNAIALWDELYYCGRCDSVYNPRSGQRVPSRDMPSLLG